MKSKYCSSTHPSLIQFQYPASPIWRRPCLIRCIAGPHARCLIGRGECSFWYDCWLRSCHLVIYNPAAASSVPVSFFWRGEVWDMGKLEDVLPTSIVEQNLLVSISSEEVDLNRWDLASDGTFHLQSAWELVRCSSLKDEVFQLFGSDMSHPRSLFWLLMRA